MLNKTKKTSFQWRHPCICILIHVDHGQRPITARVVFTSLYKRISTIKLNTDCVCLGHLANNTRSLLNNWNRFHVAVGLFSNKSQKTSKCGKKKKSGTQAAGECVTDVFTTFWSLLSDLATERNVSWRRRVQIKQLAWPMTVRQIGHRKSSLVLSARFPVVKWRSRSVAKSAY